MSAPKVDAIQRHVAKVVAEAPPLTDQQRRKLAALLAPRVEVQHG